MSFVLNIVLLAFVILSGYLFYVMNTNLNAVNYGYPQSTLVNY